MMDNLETLLQELGLGLHDILRTTLYLVDYGHFDAINAAYSQRLAARFPALTTLQVTGLPLGAKVQIDAVTRLVSRDRKSTLTTCDSPARSS